MRASIASVSYQTGLENADRVELTLVNERLRWLDHPLLALDNTLALAIVYAPDPLEQIFVGEIIGQSPTFPSAGVPMLTVVAQDGRLRLQRGTQVRWFAIPVGCEGNYPMNDMAVAGLVSAENALVPIFDPISAVIAIVIGGVEIAVAKGDPEAMQKIIRKQVAESNFDFLRRIARENGWEMVIDHSGPLGGRKLRFMSLASQLTPDLTLKYGQSLIDFTPRISNVGQLAGISVNIWRPELKMEFTVTASWDWDRNALSLSIVPGYGLPGKLSGTPEALAAAGRRAQTPGAAQLARASAQRAQQQLATPSRTKQIMLVEEPVTKDTAPRVILSKLLDRLNRRLTGSGSTIGDPRIRAGVLLRLEGLGERFGGLYRVTSATHTIDSGGYRTSFEVRKEVWFGSIPLVEQGAVRLRLQEQTVVRV